MQINKYIGAIVLFLGLGLSAPVMAADSASAQCKEGKAWSENVAMAAENDIAVVKITPEQFKNFSDLKGPPPNTDTDKPFDIYLLKKEGTAMLFIVQDGCVTVTAGPMMLQSLTSLLGLNDA